MSHTHKRKKEFYEDYEWEDDDYVEVSSKKDKKKERDERRRNKRSFDNDWPIDENYR